MINLKYIDQEIKYDGSQLCSTWAYRSFGLKGPSIVAFTGECHVDLGHMVDIEDVLCGDYIYSEKMLSFIIEHFDMDLEKTVTRQRLLMAIIVETLTKMSPSTIERKGDDIYIGNKKLSVSIATLTRVSTMIHVGLNLSSRGTPVETISLPELGITDTKLFATTVMKFYVEEINSIFMARCKVRGVD